MHAEIPEIPLSLYIHFPWCVKKCPYCDFNSHQVGGDLPEASYVDTLVLNLEQQLPYIQNRTINTIFMGGGTPSLFSGSALDRLLCAIKARCTLAPNCEITLEANPGTIEQAKFKEYYAIGINRLSIGIQSFQDQQLKALGRIHSGAEAQKAIETAKAAGFNNFNLDLMFGLPKQSIEQGLSDLRTALSFSATHLSWYELTLEPNTAFWHHPPILPKEEAILDLQAAGQAILSDQGYAQYEVSAYARENKICQHNLNYWEFGDYLAIGAGSHGKITLFSENKIPQIKRFTHFRHPKKYMDHTQGLIESIQDISPDMLAFEFMLNALRLKNGVAREYFEKRTGLPFSALEKPIATALENQWIVEPSERLCTTPQGYAFLNDVISLFLA